MHRGSTEVRSRSTPYFSAVAQPFLHRRDNAGQRTFRPSNSFTTQRFALAFGQWQALATTLSICCNQHELSHPAIDTAISCRLPGKRQAPFQRFPTTFTAAFPSAGSSSPSTVLSSYCYRPEWTANGRFSFGRSIARQYRRDASQQ